MLTCMDAWERRAACRDSEVDFLSNLEAEEPDPAAVAICEPCGVRVECMQAALSHDDWGVRAGTSHHQRQQLRRRYRRVICPRCRQNSPVVEVDGGQVCLACAVSWRATPARSAR
jgi:hypothetical protein